MAFLNLFLTAISGQYRKTYAIIDEIYYLNQNKINAFMYLIFPYTMKGTKFLSHRRTYFRSFIKANTFCGHQERRKEKKEMHLIY